MPLDFQLSLVTRLPEEVVVSLRLHPSVPLQVDGVSLRLLSREERPLAARVVLPISGQLHDTMLSMVQICADQEIPPGSRVVGVAWVNDKPFEADCSTDQLTKLESHMRGTCCCRSGEADSLQPLDREERAILAQHFPWLVQSWRPQSQVLETKVAIADAPTDDPRPSKSTLADTDDVGSFCDAHGLDEADAAWLNDLLTDEV